MRWDEASCVQFGYLYTEITQKAAGDIVGFFGLAGRPRPFPASRCERADVAPRPSLRLASVDIGGFPVHRGPGVCGDGVKDLDANRNLVENVSEHPIENVVRQGDPRRGPTASG